MIEDSDRFVDELKDKAHDLYEENKELKSRIEKAIEYIKEHEGYCMEISDYIIEILRGEDEEWEQ